MEGIRKTATTVCLRNVVDLHMFQVCLFLVRTYFCLGTSRSELFITYTCICVCCQIVAEQGHAVCAAGGRAGLAWLKHVSRSIPKLSCPKSFQSSSTSSNRSAQRPKKMTSLSFPKQITNTKFQCRISRSPIIYAM